MTPDDLDTLRRAKELLERPSFVVKLTSLLGTPLEKGLARLPERWSGAVSRATTQALNQALRVAITTLNRGPGTRASDAGHKLAAATSGAVGGAGGLVTLTIELPISTTIILRSIADIARSEGEDLGDPAARLACLEVFALGGPTTADDAAETGYWAVRLGLATATARAAQHLAAKGLTDDGAPVIIRLITAIAARFNLVVSEKVAAQAIPVVGAAGGAAINTLFIGHYQDMARGHFTIRRLERAYGQDVVRREYERLG
jgi:hypothetical protein